ncbi:MAG: glycosyltransferase family 4 protein [Terriglobales bacterium]
MLQGSESIQLRPFVLPAHANDANEFEGSAGLRPARTKLLGLKPPLWWGAGAQLAAIGAKADLLFSPTLRNVPLGLVPTVTMIADTTPLKLPELLTRRGFSDRVFLNLSSRLSERVITISECSKRDIVEAYGLNPEKVTVTYLGFDTSIFSSEPADRSAQEALFVRLGIRKPFILHHGSLHIRKNLVRLIKAHSLLMQRHPDWDLQLVLVGTYSWRHEEILEEAQKLGHESVVVTGPLPDGELVLLLKEASAEVIPSLYEGFCLPMLEAMACGIPTITSNNSCLPEVSGGILRYFDPLSIDSMASEIENVLCDTSVQRQLSSAGLKRAAEFSWTKCARETLMALCETYQEISGRSLQVPELIAAGAPVHNNGAD